MKDLKTDEPSKTRSQRKQPLINLKGSSKGCWQGDAADFVASLRRERT